MTMSVTMNLAQTAILLIIATGLNGTSVSPELDFNNVENIDNVENLVQYEYQYSVDEGLRKGPVMDRWERRLGEYVKGGYSVVDPDGAVRTVDYEVDGHKGYHAVIRFNPPSRALLSSVQLAHSNDLFPLGSTANQVAAVSELPLPTPTSSDLPHNYHAKPPYINKFGYKDYKTAASTNIAMSSQLPPSPVNYNALSHKRNPIFYKSPAGRILPPAGPTPPVYNLDALLPRQGEPLSTGGYTLHTQAIPRPPPPTLKRNSKLVKRFDSFQRSVYIEPSNGY